MNFIDIIKSVFTLALLNSMIRISLSIVYAGMGEMITEKSGVLNIGVEGVMLFGAFSAVIGTYLTGSPWIGLLLAILVSILIGFIFAYIAITLKSEQAIVGLAIYLLSVGLTGYLLQVIFSHGGNSPRVETLPNITFGFLEHFPALAKVFNGHSILMIPALLLPVILHFFFQNTPWGTWVRAAGENPHALAVVGINPVKVRYISTIVGSALAGVGGAYLAISQTSLFSENMVAGRGFVALAACIFGGARPWSVFTATIFFGFMDALQISLQTAIPDTIIPRYLFMALPYLLTLFILAGFGKRTGGPSNIGQPYYEESR